jgi:hypothetical protein
MCREKRNKVGKKVIESNLEFKGILRWGIYARRKLNVFWLYISFRTGNNLKLSPALRWL